MSNIRISLGFDMRAPDLGTPTRDLGGGGRNGARRLPGSILINLMEHHASEDGYLPQPFLQGSARRWRRDEAHPFLARRGGSRRCTIRSTWQSASRCST
ncbi:MAG: hypothetical protein R3D89_07855 [Sphingomonadaceae bacterium]